MYQKVSLKSDVGHMIYTKVDNEQPAVKAIYQSTEMVCGGVGEVNIDASNAPHYNNTQ